MKTKTIKLYQIDELPTEARAKTIAKHSDINVDYDWWDFTYDDFYTMASYFGLNVDLKKTYFTLSQSQGNGSAFTAYIDALKLIDCIKSQSWKEYAPEENFNFVITPNIERISKLIASKYIDYNAWVETANRETDIRLETEYGFDNPNSNKSNIETAIEELTDLIESVCKSLNKWFFNSLRDESDYRQTNEAVIETLKANEYYFDLAGDIHTPDHIPTLRERLTNIFRAIRSRMSWPDLLMAIPMLTALIRAFLTA